MKSLLRHKKYTQDWVKDFYTQAGIWWGDDPQAAGTHETRADTIERICGKGVHRVLDLGAGPGRTAAAVASRGHTVVAVELNPTDAASAREYLETQTRKVNFLEADFYTVEIPERFDVVTCWQSFGIGSDADQRLLLRRIAEEWLEPDGKVILDVYHPAGPLRDAGREWRLDPLPGVPGSVEMIERCHFDPIQSRWIDEWVPVAKPENALAQAIRCYAPADLLLLLEGTGLRLERVEIAGEVIDVQAGDITPSSHWFEKDYNYLVVLRRSKENELYK